MLLRVAAWLATRLRLLNATRADTSLRANGVDVLHRRLETIEAGSDGRNEHTEREPER